MARDRTDPVTDHGNEAGFTLVEVLVSMFIFSLISVGAFIALSTTLDAREAVQTRIDEVEELAAARRLMADDFAAMIYRQNRDGLGGVVDAQQQAVLIDGFELTRRGRPNPEGIFPRGDLLRVAWRVENGQLIRSFLPHENPASLDPPIDRVVLDGVESMDIDPFVGSVDGLSGSVSNSVQQISPALSIRLTHDNGTTTRHLFELPND